MFMSFERRRLITMCAATAALLIATTGAVLTEPATATAKRDARPFVTTQSGTVHGLRAAGAYEFRGIPYAAPPTGRLRWKPPEPVEDWRGVQDATAFGDNCPQQPSPFTSGPTSEDCLYLNVSTPDLTRQGRGRPVLVWIHGGGFTNGAGRAYDPTALVDDGIVVVTINYRLGALGFLSHPALAAKPGGPSGNYGLMDQQAALRWVQENIRQFGGNPDQVTIAGQSAGGLAVLMHMVSAGSRGLFQRAIVQSGSFAPTQLPLEAAESFGTSFAALVDCPDQTAACLRQADVAKLVNRFPPAFIPGVVDGKVLKESVGAALAGGRFARVPVLNGMNHDEELIFVIQKLAVSGGTFVQIQEDVTPDSYQRVIASVMGVSDARAAAIATEYPIGDYPWPDAALSTLVADANFACTALQQNLWTAARVPTFAYEFLDDASPPRYAPLPVATHTSELPYLFGLPDAPIQVPLNPDQEKLAAAMQAAWASFAAQGDPSTSAVPWPPFHDPEHAMSLVTPQPTVESDFATKHHCSFWGVG